MLDRYANVVYRHAKLVLALAGLALIAASIVGAGAFGKLKGGGFIDPGSEATRAQQVIDEQFGGQANFVLLVRARTGSVESPAMAAAGTDLTARLAAEPGVSSVASFWTTGATGLRSADMTEGLIVAHLAGDDDQAADHAESLIERYAVDSPVSTIRAGGSAAARVDINEQVTKSLIIAEAIAVPLTWLLLVLVFGSLVSAVLPMAIAGISVMGTFAGLYFLGSVTDVSVFAINLTTALGLGLGIDYALLLVSRFREQLAAGDSVPDAVRHTVVTAGRTILFAAMTVAAALATLLIFPQYFLRSFAYAGIGVVVISAVSALVVMPALLSVLGPRVNKGRVRWSQAPLGAESRTWRRIAAFVMRRPVLTALPIIVMLLFCATPLRHIEFGTPDAGVLPADVGSRQVADRLAENFTGNGTTTVNVIAAAARPEATLPEAGLITYAQQLSRLPGVVRVDASVGSFTDGEPATPAGDPADLARPGTERLTVVSDLPTKSGAAQQLVAAVRAVPAPAGTVRLVGGVDADLVDTRHAIAQRLPIGILLIVVSTFILLFLFTGSLLQPVRALLLNALGLSATLGVMTWIFQDGHLAGLLGFTPRPMDTSMTVLLFCIAFGLSMDYEVFLISRIKELHDNGASLTSAVTSGLGRTGRIVSAAAGLLAVSLFAFGAGTISFIQMFGIGSGLAILIDATLIRGVLVPAFMRAAGATNWYLPRPLRNLHHRIGLTESGPAKAVISQS